MKTRRIRRDGVFRNRKFLAFFAVCVSALAVFTAFFGIPAVRFYAEHDYFIFQQYSMAVVPQGTRNISAFVLYALNQYEDDFYPMALINAYEVNNTGGGKYWVQLGITQAYENFITPDGIVLAGDPAIIYQVYNMQGKSLINPDGVSWYRAYLKPKEMFGNEYIATNLSISVSEKGTTLSVYGGSLNGSLHIWLPYGADSLAQHGEQSLRNLFFTGEMYEMHTNNDTIPELTPAIFVQTSPLTQIWGWKFADFYNEVKFKVYVDTGIYVPYDSLVTFGGIAFAVAMHGFQPHLPALFMATEQSHNWSTSTSPVTEIYP